MVESISDLSSVSVVQVAGDTTRVLLGNMRAELRTTSSVNFGLGRTAANLRAATVDRDGHWLFLSADGIVLSSDTFLGPLRRVGESSAMVSTVSSSEGTLYFVDEFHRGWIASTSGMGVRQFPSRTVHSGAFLQAEVGVYIDLVGNVWRTQGPQLPEQPVPIAGAALSVVAAGEHWVVRTSRGFQRINRQGQVSPSAATVETQSTLSTSEHWALLQATLRRWPASIWSLAPKNEPALLDPMFAFDRDLVHVDANSGAVLSVDRSALPHAKCRIRVARTRLIFDCPPSEQHYLWSRSLGLRPFIAPGGRETLRVSSNGTLLAGARCPQSPRGEWLEPQPDSAWCVMRADSTEWESIVFSLDHRIPWQVRENIGLASVISETRAGLMLFDVDSKQTEELLLPQSPRAHQYMHSGRIAPDGTPWGRVTIDRTRTAHARTPRYNLARWTNRTQPAELTALPPEVQIAGLQTSLIGYASGRTAQHLWYSVDGTRWDPMTIAVDGSAGAVDMFGTDARDSAVRCTTDRCVIGGRLSVRGHGPLQYESDPLIAATSPFVEDTEAEEFRIGRRRSDTPAMLIAPISFVCQQLHGAASEPVPVPGDEVFPPLRLEPTSQGHFRLEGRYVLDDSSSQWIDIFPGEIELPVFVGRTDNPILAPWTIAYATRSLAIAERCYQRSYESFCDRVVLSPHFAPIRLTVDDTVPPTTDNGQFIAGLTTNGGHHALLFRPTADERTEYQILLIVDQRGAIVARKTIIPGRVEPFSALLAQRDNVVGVVRLEQDALDALDRLYAFYPLFREATAITAPPQSLTMTLRTDNINFTRCPARPAPHTLALNGRIPSSIPIEFWGRNYTRLAGRAMGTFELSSAGHFCLRQARLTPLTPNSVTASETRRERHLTLRSAPSSSAFAFEGVIHRGATTVPVRCFSP